jgi:hypothetical protein
MALYDRATGRQVFDGGVMGEKIVFTDQLGNQSRYRGASDQGEQSWSSNVATTDTLRIWGLYLAGDYGEVGSDDALNRVRGSLSRSINAQFGTGAGYPLPESARDNMVDTFIQEMEDNPPRNLPPTDPSAGARSPQQVPTQGSEPLRAWSEDPNNQDLINRIIDRASSGEFGVPGTREYTLALEQVLHDAIPIENHNIVGELMTGIITPEVRSKFRGSAGADEEGQGGGLVVPPTGGSAAVPRPIISPAPSPTPTITEATAEERELNRQQLASSTRTGRSGTFSDYLDAQGADLPPSVRRFQERQFDPIQNMFNIRRLLGTGGEADIFKDYLGERGTIRPPSEDEFAAYRKDIGQISGLLSGAPATTRQQEAIFGEDGLSGDVANQFNLAYTGIGRDIPREFQSGIRRTLGERFQNAYDLDAIARFQGIGQKETGLPFKQFSSQGTAFQGPDIGDVRGRMDPLVNLISASPLGLTENELEFRKDIRSDQERQFQFALRNRLPDVAPRYRSSFRDTARSAFDRFQANNPEGAQFLPYFQSQGSRF